MEARLFRLAVLVAALIAVGCLGYGGYCFYQAKLGDELVVSEYREMRTRQNQCWDRNVPAYQKPLVCGAAKDTQESLDLDSKIRFDYRDAAQDFLKAGAGLPFVPLLLFYAGRWVLTGKLRIRARA